MSSFFNIGLTDRFACSEKAGQDAFCKHPFTVVPNGIDTARFAARDRSAVRFCAVSWV